MADFRKWFSVLAVVALMLGAAVSASAQGQGPALACIGNAGVPPLLRAEGLTELTGDLVLNCTGGDNTKPFLMNVQIFLNTNITSRILTGNPGSSTSTLPGGSAYLGQTEALLLINEPAVPTLGTDTFFSSKAADNSVVWLGVPFTPPGSTGNTIIRITNVRANASAFAGSISSLIPQSIDAYISISGSTSVPVNNPKQTVGYVQKGLNFAVVKCSDVTSSAGSTEFNFRQCSSSNSTPFSDTTSPATAQFLLKFSENFATAFKTKIAPGQDPATPGQVYNTESGYVNSTKLGNETGFATQGTRLMATFTNVPAGVKVFVAQANGAAIDNTGALTGYGYAALISGTGLSGEGGFQATGYTQAGVCAYYTSSYAKTSGSGTFTGAAPTMVPLVTAADGTATAVWEVQNTSSIIAESFYFAVAVAYKVDIPNGIPALTTANVPVTGQFAPNYASPTGTTMSGSLPVPRFVSLPSTVNTFKIDACVTNILFPFATNQAGFDTGVAISNTTVDPYGTKAQTGTCTLNYYSNPAPAMTSEVSAIIPAGGSLTFTLSSGNSAQNVKGNPGFQGYIIAVCRFQYGHGFAFITDLGAQRLAEGYLGLIIDGSRSTTGGEALNN